MEVRKYITLWREHIGACILICALSVAVWLTVKKKDETRSKDPFT